MLPCFNHVMTVIGLWIQFITKVNSNNNPHSKKIINCTLNGQVILRHTVFVSQISHSLRFLQKVSNDHQKVSIEKL